MSSESRTVVQGLVHDVFLKIEATINDLKWQHTWRSSMFTKTPSFCSFLMQKSGLWSSASIKPPTVVNSPVALSFSHPWHRSSWGSSSGCSCSLTSSSSWSATASCIFYWPRCFPGSSSSHASPPGAPHPFSSSQRSVEKCATKQCGRVCREVCSGTVFLMHPGLSPLPCGKIGLSKGQNTATDQARGCQVVRNCVAKKGKHTDFILFLV